MIRIFRLACWLMLAQFAILCTILATVMLPWWLFTNNVNYGDVASLGIIAFALSAAMTAAELALVWLAPEEVRAFEESAKSCRFRRHA